MEAVSQVIGLVIKTLMDYTIKQVGYVTSSKTEVKKFENKMKELEDTRTQVEQHFNTNKINNLEIPRPVNGWLKDVEKFKKDVHDSIISSNGHTGCFNIKKRYQATKKAMSATEDIQRFIDRNHNTIWSDVPKPLGRIDSKPASAPTPSSSLGEVGDTQTGFKSRDVTFNDVLKLLQQGDDKIQLIALCGMGGLGKTTMMEQLKKVADDKNMFNWIVKIVIGRDPNMYSIQNDIAVYTGVNLPDTTETVRADLLCKRFQEMLQQGKKKILVILDDVWEKIELKVIGLMTPLASGFKFLVTSRYENVCRQIATDADLGYSVVTLNVLGEVEACGLFSRITGISKDNDPVKYKIGCDILKKCGGLPLAIKLIASTLESQEMFAWKNTRDRLQNNDLDKNVQEIIEISYKYLGEEEREIFLLCGLFPEDFNIQIEDLTRYAWGLRLLKGVFTLQEARNRTRTHVSILKNANLLINGDNDYSGCVKLHDLVLAYVVGTVSNGEDAWIIKHGNISEWNHIIMNKSCKRISLACNGRFEFPSNFKFPKLSLLKFMHADKSPSFPRNFYEEMGKLEVIAYEEFKYPLVPTSSHCFTNLRTLCINKCSLMFDYSSVGNLRNLEVLSFANCGIQKLPSTISNLKKLRLLDITGSVNLDIDNGVLRNLMKLEELYMRLGAKKKCFRFTVDIWKEVAEISKRLIAFETELHENNVEPKNISFEKLESFKISLGCYLEEENEKIHSLENENTLMLVTNRDDLHETRINELFEKTDVLYLKVDGMIDLEDVDMKPLRPQHYSFYNLRVLVVSGCEELRSLFKLNVAMSLSNLEHLAIENCPLMEEFIHDESNGAQKVTFPKMKSLTIRGLPNFTSIFPVNKLATCCTLSDISPTQIFFSEQVVIPKLEKLCIDDMENLKKIWPCQFNGSEEVNVSMLREIKVTQCDCLENVFPSNPMSWLLELEKVKVSDCNFIEVLFDIDMDCVGEIEAGSNSRLRSIKVINSRSLREIWRVKGVNNSGINISGFEAVERIKINECMSFRNIFTPITSSFDLRSLTDIEIEDSGEMWGNDKPLQSNQQEINVKSKEEISKVAFPPDLIHNFHLLHNLCLDNFGGVEVVFEIDSREPSIAQGTNGPLLLLPYLKDLNLMYMKRMTHVWKCSNWNEFLILQHQQREPSFLNLTNIYLRACKNIKYLFSPLMAQLLSNLKNVDIYDCDGIEEVVSSRDDEEGEMSTLTYAHKNTTLFPHLNSIDLHRLTNLKHIGGGGPLAGGNSSNTTTSASISHGVKLSQKDVLSWSLCQYSIEIHILGCPALSGAIPSHALGHMQKLQKLEIRQCESMMEVFETEGKNKRNDVGSSINVDEATNTILSTPRLNVPQLFHLKHVSISRCDKLQHVFTFFTLESLRQLEELTIMLCDALKVIVKEENYGQNTNGVVFPRLKSIELGDLPNLVGFFMGMNDFQWPSLEEVVIYRCPQMKKFTGGHSSAPKLRFLDTELGKHSLECGLNFHVIDTSHETPFLSSDHNSSMWPTTLQGMPWSFHNLIEMDTKGINDTKIIPSNELLQLQKLEKIQLSHCASFEEVFEALNEKNTCSSESQTVVKLLNLRDVELTHVYDLKYIWKSSRWTAFEFPNLTRVSISSCRNLEHVFTCSMIGSLLKLQDLHISDCENLKVIVKEEEEECDAKVKEVVELPCLKSLLLDNIPSLKGFYLGNEAFSLLSLDTVEIMECPELTIFTKGRSTTPELKVIDTSFGRCYINQDLDVFVNEKRQQGLEF